MALGAATLNCRDSCTMVNKGDVYRRAIHPALGLSRGLMYNGEGLNLGCTS